MEMTEKTGSRGCPVEGKKNHSEKMDPEESLSKKSMDKKSDGSVENTDENSVSMSRIFSVMESLFFSSDKPVGLGAFKQVFQGTSLSSVGEIKKALEKLKQSYESSSRGVRLEEINGGWQLRTKVENREFLTKLMVQRPFKLSGPALEVLSIVAYRQPVIKSEVDRVRGVESGHLMRSLMEKKLISFQGKSDLPGKPLQYGTTATFLEVFGLKNLKELPSFEDMDQLLPDGMGEGEKERGNLSDISDGMFESSVDFDLGDERELMTIGETLREVKTKPDLPEDKKSEENKDENL